MARWSVEDTTLTGIANAIREKTGGNEEIKVEDMAGKIGEISGGGSVENCTMTLRLVTTGSRNASFTYIQNGTLVIESRPFTDGTAAYYDEVFNVDKSSIFCITNTTIMSPDLDYATITNGSFLIKSAGAGVAFTVESDNVTVRIG